MARLSKEQQDQLAELERLRDAPDDDDDAGGRSEFVNVTIDLSDETAVERGIALGFLRRSDLEDDDAGKGGTDDDDDAGKGGKGGGKPGPTPRRRGYFGE